VTTLYCSLLDTYTLVSTVNSSLPLLSSGFQQWTIPFLWVPELFPASATSFSQYLRPSSHQINLLTHQLTHSTQLTPRLAAISHQPPALLTAVSRLTRNHSYFSLYSLCTDHTENSSPNSSSIVASCSYRTDRIDNTIPVYGH
jgi:hypothetical protein